MPAASASHVAAVRRFNRFYTREIGLLRKTFLDTDWTLGEMRVLYEIAHGDRPTASDIARKLDLDAAYLSRLLRRFETQGLIERSRSKNDARQSHVRLTPLGRKAFDPADRRQVEFVRGLLKRVPGPDQSRLIGAMGAIEALLSQPGSRSPAPAAYTLREHKPGDLGWIVSAHAEIYGAEYGWGGPFEGLCAQIVADFANDFDPKKERCWIAELDGERVGTVMLVKDEEGGGPDVARLRLLLVDPRARGLGLGAGLVEECLRFAREAGYKRVTLWTHSVLTAARAIYKKAGFVKTGSEQHDSWGKKVTSEFWDLEL